MFLATHVLAGLQELLQRNSLTHNATRLTIDRPRRLTTIRKVMLPAHRHSRELASHSWRNLRRGSTAACHQNSARMLVDDLLDFCPETSAGLNNFKQRPEHFLACHIFLLNLRTSSELLHPFRNTTPALFSFRSVAFGRLLCCSSLNPTTASSGLPFPPVTHFDTHPSRPFSPTPKSGLQGFRLATIPAKHRHATRKR